MFTERQSGVRSHWRVITSDRVIHGLEVEDNTLFISIF